MKKLLFILSALSFASCSKTKVVTITKIINTTTHDTAFYHQSLLGTWKPITNTSSTASPTFSLDTLYWSSGATPYQYVVSGDTIFHVIHNYLYPEHCYTFSKNYDTLTMYDLFPFKRTSMFKKL